MPIIEKMMNFLKKKTFVRGHLKANFNNLSLANSNLVIFLSFVVFFSITYFFVEILVSKTNEKNRNNVINLTKSSEFSNFTNFIISKINSPYVEVNYTIKNNDSIEKILKKYNISSPDIKKISQKLKQKKSKSILQKTK